MPLFGHKTDHHTTQPAYGPTATSVPTGPTTHRRDDPVGLARDPNYNNTTDRHQHGGHGLTTGPMPDRHHDEEYDRSMPAEYGRGGAGAAGMNPRDHHLGHPDPYDNNHTGRYDQPGYNTSTGPGHHMGATNPTVDTGYGGTGHHTGPTTAGMGTTAGLTSATNPTLRQGKKLERSGQLEHAVGTIISSQSMKTKGAMKEEEGHRMKVQAEELARAERLEQQAQISRSRAQTAGHVPGGTNVTGRAGGLVGGM